MWRPSLRVRWAWILLWVLVVFQEAGLLKFMVRNRLVKPRLTMHAIAEAQKKGGLAAFIDAEHAFDKTYAEKLGIDTENLLISQPDNGEQALEIAEHLIRSGAIDIIVIDSVAALVPKAELEGEMGESKMGLQARLMSQALKKTDRYH
jgi:recombination protein RecA